MPPKPDLVFTNAPNDVETDHSAFNVKLSPTKPDQNVPSFVQPPKQVKSPRPSIQHVETSIPTKTSIPKPTCNGKRRNRKACFVCKSVDHLIKDYDYHEKKMAQPTARNHVPKGTVVVIRFYSEWLWVFVHQGCRHHVFRFLVPINVARPITDVVPKIKVTRPRHDTPIVTNPNSPTRRHINRSPSPQASNSPPRVTAVKALVVNPAQ
nr:hypothetical protein [Tanacetum cinerariifolium]